MAYATKDALCNAALNFLGEPDATPFTGGTTVRDVACARHYDHALQHVLTLHRWDFATALDALTLASPQPTLTPADFPYAYTLNSDFLRLQEILLSSGARLLNYRIMGVYLFLDADTYEGNIVYSINDIATTLMPGVFADCLMMELCKRIAPMLTQSPQTLEQMANHYRETFARAITAETRQTQSGENSSPIALARQSEIYRSRF